MTLRLLILNATLSASILLSAGKSYAQSELAKIAEWTAVDGISGELSGAPIRALGYAAPVPVKQKAFRSGEITHLFYVTNAGEMLLGYIDQRATILWRIEKAKRSRPPPMVTWLSVGCGLFRTQNTPSFSRGK